jgi:glycogen debranching enzyme
MSDILFVNDRYYILATSALTEESRRVLKNGDTFGVFDHCGDIRPFGRGQEGLYHRGTRFLSRFMLFIDERRPLFLSSIVVEDNDLLTVDLTNQDFLQPDGTPTIRHGSVHLYRSRFLRDGTAYERICLFNHSHEPLEFAFELQFQNDFADLFEVRGVRRERRGTLQEPLVTPEVVVLGYEGLDNITRRTRLMFSPPPQTLTADEATYRVALAPGQDTEMVCVIDCEVGNEPAHSYGLERAFEEVKRELDDRRKDICRIHTSNQQFNDWVNRSQSDLLMLVTDTVDGPYPYAGVPWYSTVFGRDGILTALEWLWAYPNLARGVLLHLAHHQADAVDPKNDAESGKILHESRSGEMAALGEIPFGRYYGSVDATPLFVVLAAGYLQRTADRSFLERLWPTIERALNWMRGPGDPDHDGFLEYQRRSGSGLSNQGWKDSWDSIFHADGQLAEPPIAVCEVQAYAYAAWHGAAQIAVALDHPGLAQEYRLHADSLRRHFHDVFWCEDKQTYGLALDRDKRLCRIESSNAGHTLFTGIASPDAAAKMAKSLLAEKMFSGWGVRTLAAGEARYNPLSYHNGSIWPHDNALCAVGLASYGFKAEAITVLGAMFDASRFVELSRLPELYCGLPRRRGEGPTLYPVACSPQAWATGVPHMILASLLGLEIDANRKYLRLIEPVLPPFLDTVEIENLIIGDSRVHVLLRRDGDSVSIRHLSADDVHIVLKQ